MKKTYTNFCCKCGKEFSPLNPCYNDNGFIITHTGTYYRIDGECKACANKRTMIPLLKHDWLACNIFGCVSCNEILEYLKSQSIDG